MKFLSKPIKDSLGEIAVALLGIAAVSMMLTYSVMPPKYKASTYAYDSFGSTCEKSSRELTQTLTVVKQESSGTYDEMCISGSGKYRMYSTKEGIYFDSFRQFTSGDIVTVTGKYYVRDGDTIVISGDLIDDVQVRKDSYYLPFPTATPINVTDYKTDPLR